MNVRDCYGLGGALSPVALFCWRDIYLVVTFTMMLATFDQLHMYIFAGNYFSTAILRLS